MVTTKLIWDLDSNAGIKLVEIPKVKHETRETRGKLLSRRAKVKPKGNYTINFYMCAHGLLRVVVTTNSDIKGTKKITYRHGGVTIGILETT